MMFRAFAVAFFALLPFAPNVAAQTSPLVAPVPSITVQGDAATQVSPDQASTTVTIRNEHKDLKAAKAENDKKVAALLALTKKYNVANDKVQTAYTSLNPVYDYRPNEKPALRGYEASTSINVTLVETTKMAGFLNDVIASGIDQLGSVSFSLQDEKKVERHTLLKALKNAEEQAVMR